MMHIRRSILFVLLLMMSSAALAQGKQLELRQNDKDAIGVIEIRIVRDGNPEGDSFERATGAIISGSGFVLTASHIFSAEALGVCGQIATNETAHRCEMSFYRYGDKARRLALTLATGRQVSHDFILLRLPTAGDKIGQPEWPHLTMSNILVDGEPLLTAGYRGSTPLEEGASNPLEFGEGRLGAGQAAACGSQSWGPGRRFGGIGSPGVSGAPVFNRAGRIIGIFLGEACDGAGSAASIQDNAQSRILPLSDMPGLCTDPRYKCFFGFKGDIDPRAPGDDRKWDKRLIGGESLADKYIYGWKMRAVSKLINYALVCAQLNSDQQLVDEIESDADSGSQLAGLYSAFWPTCRQGTSPAELERGFQKLVALADAGYEPAQFFAGSMLLQRLQPKLIMRTGATDPLLLSLAEKDWANQANTYLESAHSGGWPAASYLLLEMCRLGVTACDGQRKDELLDAAAANQQVDAVRLTALLSLLGPEGTAQSIFGMARPKDINRAIMLFQQNAQPVQGASKNPNVTLFDNVSAGFLSYFFGGGRYQGETVTPYNPSLQLYFFNSCLGGMGAGTPMFEFCGMINAVSRFNSAADANARAEQWTFIQNFRPWAPQVSPLAINLSSWSSDGRDIEKISCDLNDFLALAPPLQAPNFQNKVAYCYFLAPK